MKILIILSVLFAFSTPALSMQLEYSAKADSVFNKAVELYKQGNLDHAEALVAETLRLSPNHLTTTALSFQARIAADKKEYNRAEHLIRNFVKENPNSKYINDMRLLKARIDYERGFFIKSMEELLTLITLAEDDIEREIPSRNFLNMLVPGVSEFVLNEFKARFNYVLVDDLIEIKKAQLAVNEGDYEKALEHLDSVTHHEPLSDTIREIRTFIEDRFENEQYIVVLLSTTGENASQGAGILRGAQYALDKYNAIAENPLKLKPIDTRGDVVNITKLISEISNDHSVLGVIGPVDPLLQVVVAAVAETHELPVILPTNSSHIDPIDIEYIFNIVGSPEKEGATLARYALNELQDSTFAILSPFSEIEERIASSFVEEVENSGGEIFIHERYYPGTYILQSQFSNIRSIGYNMMVEDSLHLFIRDMFFDSLTIALDSLTEDYMDSVVYSYTDTLSLSELDTLNTFYQDSLAVLRLEQGVRDIDSLLYPVDKFEATLMLVTEPAELDVVVNQFAFYNFKTDLIGNSAWYDLQMLDRVSSSLRYTDLYFTSDFLIEPYYMPWSEFRDTYRNDTGKTPEIAEIYGFDSMNYAVQSIAMGARTRAQFWRNLKQVVYINGSPRGIVEMDSNGQKQNWIILRYLDGRISVK